MITANSLPTLLLTNAALMALLAAMVWILAGHLRNPALAHAGWTAVLVKLFLPPILVTPILTAHPAAETVAALSFVTQSVNSTSGAATAGTSWNLIILLSLVAAAGSLGILIKSLHAMWRFRRLMRWSRPASPDLVTRLATLANRVGLRKAPPVRLLDAPISPLLWGVRPTLVLPAGLQDELAGHELDALLTHELVHMRRRDPWVRLLELTAQVVYWWHPAVWWTTRELRRAEELACDTEVVKILNNARIYADGLLKTVAFVRGTRQSVPPLACGATAAEDLKGRLTMILTRKPTPSLTSTLTAIAFVLLLAGGLTVFPVGAQSSQDESTSITLSANGEPILDVLRQVATQSQVNLVVHPSVPAGQMIDVDLENASLDDTLASLLKVADLGQTRTGNVVEIHPRGVVLERSVSYSGQPIDLDLEDASLRAVLKSFASMAGLKLDLPKQIDGAVTVSLRSVPWDLAMEVILTMNGLHYEIHDGVVHVATS